MVIFVYKTALLPFAFAPLRNKLLSIILALARYIESWVFSSFCQIKFHSIFSSMVLKIEIPNNVVLGTGDEIVIKFTDRQYSCSVEPGTPSSDAVRMDASESTPDGFVDFAETVLQQLRERKEYRLVETYSCAKRKFLKFRGQEDILMCDISQKIIEDYECYLKQSGLTLNSISFYMRILRAIYNRAVRRGLVQDCRPFDNVFTKMTKTAKRAISVETIQKLAAADIKNKTERLARDLFLFSFYTRGMAFVDIAFLRKSDIHNGYLIYKRKKTGQELKVAWRKQMQDIVDRNPSLDGDHLLGVLDNQSKKGIRFQCHYKQCHINEALKRLAKRMELDVHLTMYVARHSWATIAKERNVPISVISDSMGHNSEKTTQIYLKSVDADVIDRNNDLLIEAVSQTANRSSSKTSV